MSFATASDGADLTGLPRLGVTCGYQLFEANLDAPADRAILVREHLLSDERRLLVGRHPSDAITAPQATVRVSRPFLLFAERQPGFDDVSEVRTLEQGLAYGNVGRGCWQRNAASGASRPAVDRTDRIGAV